MTVIGSQAFWRRLDEVRDHFRAAEQGWERTCLVCERKFQCYGAPGEDLPEPQTFLPVLCPDCDKAAALCLSCEGRGFIEVSWPEDDESPWHDCMDCHRQGWLRRVPVRAAYKG